MSTRNHGSISLFLFCFIVISGIVNAQENAVAAPQAAGNKTSAEVSSHDTPATFKAKVNLVLVPVVVRDSQGHAIGNLKQENFQLFDKGKPQVISKFSVEKSGGRTAAGQPRADDNKAEKATGEAAPPLAAPERYIAYLFDDVHLEFGDLARVRDATERHLASLQPTDRAAILSTSGQTHLEFTDDRARLHETLLRLQPRPITRSMARECPDVDYYMADLIQTKNDPQALSAATAEAIACMQIDTSTPQAMQAAIQQGQQAARSAANRGLSNGDQETRVSLGVLKDAIRLLSGMPGQRSIILVSPGFYTPSDVQQQKTEIIERAIHSNVIINALDARGLYTIIPGGDASQATVEINSAGLKARFQSDSALVQADLLAEMAEGTGGTFFHNSNDLDEGFKRVADAPEYYYLLGFSRQNLKLDGSFHRLKVTVKELGKLNLQARRGYYAPRHEADAAETAKQEIQDALFSREELHDIPVELHTQFFKADDQNARVAVLARVDVRHLRFRKVDGRNRDDLTVVSGLFDRNGNYIMAVRRPAQEARHDHPHRRTAPVPARADPSRAGFSTS